MQVTVLIVDDNEDTRKLYEFALTHTGHSVTGVSNGADTIQLLANYKPDLIIADIVMPEVSGIDLIKFVRKQHDLASIPIIVISGYYRGYHEEARKAGATVVLDKPVDPVALPTIVDRLLASVSTAD